MAKKNPFKKVFNNLTHNVVVLYILVAIAILNVYLYLVNNRLSALVLFLVVGLGTSFLTKNMIWILFSTILITNAITATGLLQKNSYLEGMKKGKSKKEKEKEKKEKEKKKHKKKHDDEGDGEEGDGEEGDGEEGDGEEREMENQRPIQKEVVKKHHLVEGVHF